jgi:hypothetical protein
VPPLTLEDPVAEFLLAVVSEALGAALLALLVSAARRVLAPRPA